VGVDRNRLLPVHIVRLRAGRRVASDGPGASRQALMVTLREMREPDHDRLALGQPGQGAGGGGGRAVAASTCSSTRDTWRRWSYAFLPRGRGASASAPAVGRGAAQQAPAAVSPPDAGAARSFKYIGEGQHGSWLPAEQLLLLELDCRSLEVMGASAPGDRRWASRGR